MDEEKLRKYLMKCELQYRAEHGDMNRAATLDWLAPYCGTLDALAGFLRELGFRIREIVDDVDASGAAMRWVETTSGVIVYAETQGMFALSIRCREKRRRAHG